MKVCSSCKLEKAKKAFSKNKNKKDGLQAWCKDCTNKYQKAWREEDPEKAYKAIRKWKRNNPGRALPVGLTLTLEEYNKILDEQQGVCAICQREDPNQRLSIDHCHTTVQIRGLLCSKCNCGLGFFEDNIKVLERAISYLRGETSVN